MTILGLEVRKHGSIFNLYKDVETILTSNGISKTSISNELEIATVAICLQKMIKQDSFFNICTIDNCCKVTGIIIPQERYKIYRAIHCVDWNTMTPQYRQLIIAMILDDFKTILNV